MLKEVTGVARARSSCSSTSCTPSSARARPRARWTRPTCSSRCWRAASCTASARRRSTSTASTSRRTPRSSAASSRCSSTSRRVEDTISILRGLKERYEVHHGVRIKDAALVAAAVALATATSPTASCPTRPSTCRRGGQPRCASRSTRCPPSSTRSSAGVDAARDRARGAEARRPTTPRKARLERARARARRRCRARPARSSASGRQEKARSPSLREIARADSRSRQLEIEQAERAGDLRQGRGAPVRHAARARRAGSTSRGGRARPRQAHAALLKEEVDEEDIAEVVGRVDGHPGHASCSRARSQKLLQHGGASCTSA